MTAQLATRVMKARRSSVLACGHYVMAGQLIVYRGEAWMCLGCALESIRARQKETTP